MSYIWGTANIRGEITIEQGVNDTLQFDVSGVTYTIVLDAGKYRTTRELHHSTFVEALNEKLVSQGCPYVVVLGGALDDNGKGNYVVFSWNVAGTPAPYPQIENVRGNMKNFIFAQ